MISAAPFYLGPFLITPHPLSPHFATPTSAAEYFPSVAAELSSGHSTNREGYNLIRELCRVSYYSFMNGILRFSGIYDGLEDDLSLDMMNYRQSSLCEQPGAKAATFMPRGFSKSRVFTHGGLTFDFIRNPDESAIIVNAIYDKALEFLHFVERNFDSNEAMAYFFPEFVPGNGKGQVTDKVLILPNKKAPGEVSCKCFGLTGAAEGGHFDILQIDDLVGLDSLDQNRQSTAQMGTARKWFQTNQRALRKTRDSRIIVAATRYALDDCYADIYGSCHSVTGWTKGDLQPDPLGSWDVYYRLVEEDGKYLRNNVMDEKGLKELMESDFWAAMTQYYNSPMKAGLAEFAEYKVKECELLEDDEDGRLWIRRKDPNRLDGDSEMEIALSSCDLCITTDLAATEDNMKAKSCRSAILVWAEDSRENLYLLWSKVGFFSFEQSMDYIFLAARAFGMYSSGSLIENNAFQKIVKPWVEREQSRRNVYVNPIAINARGDKKARIRTAFGIPLVKGKIWSTPEAAKPLIEELKMFPMSDNRLDTLDASEKAFVFLQRPATEEEREAEEIRMEIEDAGAPLSCAGY